MEHWEARRIVTASRADPSNRPDDKTLERALDSVVSRRIVNGQIHWGSEHKSVAVKYDKTIVLSARPYGTF